MVSFKNATVKCLIKFKNTFPRQRPCISEINKSIENHFQIACVLHTLLCISQIQGLCHGKVFLNLIKHFMVAFLKDTILPYLISGNFLENDHFSQGSNTVVCHPKMETSAEKE